MTVTKVKKTPWFNAVTCQPVYVGVYEYYDSFWCMTDGTAHWDGKCWTRGPADYRGAPYNGDRWRGLLTPCVEAAGDAPAERQK